MSVETSSDQQFGRGAVFAFLLTMAADGIHWLITPMSHPDASDARTYAVVAQIIVCGAIAAWVYATRRRATAT